MFGLSAFAQAPFASLGTTVGPNIIVSVATNVGVMSAGTVVVSAGATLHEFISGVEATSALGTTTFTASTTPPITGVSTTSAIGNLENIAGAVVNVTNTIDTDTITGVTAVGNTVVFGGAVQGVSSSGKTAALGDEIIIADCNVTAAQIGSVSATIALGNESLITENKIIPTGVLATSSLGDETISGNATINPNGISLIGTISSVRVWSEVDEDQSSNFTPVNDSQTPNWNTVTDTQNPDWNEVA